MLRPMFRAGASVSRLLSTEAVAVSDSAETGERRLKKIGRALETYLRNSKDHVAMMARERADFELGKRHLANMMGIDPHAVTQHDIDRAIEYLFPSGLSDLKARPVMKPPDEILPRFHRFTFDDEGRPHGSRFYTLNSKFYGLLSEVGAKTHNIGRFYSERVTLRDRNDADLQTASLSGTTWLSEEKMRKKIGEKISTEMYTQLLMAFEHLASLPGSAIENEFIGEFREPLASGTTSRLFGPDVPTVEICPQTNRRLATVRTRVKGTHATVSVRDAGTGQWEVDGQPLYTFRSLLAREILLCPLIVADLLGRVDVVAQSEGFGGETAVPRAVRHGTALCIAALFPETSERLRLAGLLTSDPRKKERSKVNQPGARAKWIWKRR